MATTTHWDWSDPKGQRRLHTVGDHILWSYSALTVTRIAMSCIKAGKPNPYRDGRAKGANMMMKQYEGLQKNITNPDRDDRLAQGGSAVCAHFGCSALTFHFDHLIPQSKIKDDYIPLNQVRSCPRCNTSRGNKELMVWHRQNRTFPSLAVLRRYLKLCYGYAKQRECLDDLAKDASKNGLPFDPVALPRKLPPLEQLVWDYAYPEFWPAQGEVT